MCSSEDEKVNFSEIINPENAKGAVEKWLLQVEKVMQSSIYQQIKESLFAYPKSTRENWILEWPGQVCSVYFSFDVDHPGCPVRKSNLLDKRNDRCSKNW